MDNGTVDYDCLTPSWHGTKVASILAARHGSGVYGTAYNASIMSVRVLGRCSSGYANDITDAIVWAIGGAITGMQINPRLAHIVSMSLSGVELCPSYLQYLLPWHTRAGLLFGLLLEMTGLQHLPILFQPTASMLFLSERLFATVLWHLTAIEARQGLLREEIFGTQYQY